MASIDRINIKSSKNHHYVRTIISSLFGFLALALIIVSILVVWINRTLTDTGQYTKTVAPLVTNPDIQSFVVDKASGALLDNGDAPIRDIAGQLLGPEHTVGKTDDQLKAEVTPVLKDSLRTVLGSQAFATLWQTNNHDIHSQLISQLKSNSSTITLNFHPLIVGTIDQLGTTKLGFVKDKLELKDNVGTVTVREKQLDTVRKVYDYFNKAMLAIIALAVLASALCVLISVHHLKTVRRIALLTGIFAGLLALVLSAASLIKPAGADVAQQKFAAALVNGITHDLRIALITVALVGILGAAGSKLYVVLTTRKPKASQSPQKRKS